MNKYNIWGIYPHKRWIDADQEGTDPTDALRRALKRDEAHPVHSRLYHDGDKVIVAIANGSGHKQAGVFEITTPPEPTLVFKETV